MSRHQSCRSGHRRRRLCRLTTSRHDLVDQSLPLLHGRRTPDIGLGPLGILSNLSGCVSACLCALWAATPPHHTQPSPHPSPQPKPPRHCHPHPIAHRDADTHAMEGRWKQPLSNQRPAPYLEFHKIICCTPRHLSWSLMALMLGALGEF